MVGGGMGAAVLAGCFVGTAAVVAGFANVGIWAGNGGWVARAVALPDKGVQHLTD